MFFLGPFPPAQTVACSGWHIPWQKFGFSAVGWFMLWNSMWNQWSVFRSDPGTPPLAPVDMQFKDCLEELPPPPSPAARRKGKGKAKGKPVEARVSTRTKTPDHSSPMRIGQEPGIEMPGGGEVSLPTPTNSSSSSTVGRGLDAAKDHGEATKGAAKGRGKALPGHGSTAWSTTASSASDASEAETPQERERWRLKDAMTESPVRTAAAVTAAAATAAAVGREARTEAEDVLCENCDDGAEQVAPSEEASTAQSEDVEQEGVEQATTCVPALPSNSVSSNVSLGNPSAAGRSAAAENLEVFDRPESRPGTAGPTSGAAEQRHDDAATQKRPPTIVRVKVCWKCDRMKPERAHHCSVCRRCVMKMDHHCPWTNNCIGYGNYHYFCLYLFWVWFGNLSYVVLCFWIVGWDLLEVDSDQIWWIDVGYDDPGDFFWLLGLHGRVEDGLSGVPPQ